MVVFGSRSPRAKRWLLVLGWSLAFLPAFLGWSVGRMPGGATIAVLAVWTMAAASTRRHLIGVAVVASLLSLLIPGWRWTSSATGFPIWDVLIGLLAVWGTVWFVLRFLGDSDPDSQPMVIQSPIATESLAPSVTEAYRVQELCTLLEELRGKQSTLDGVISSVAEGIFGVDRQGKCLFINQAAVRLLGYESDRELLTQQMHELVHHSYSDGTPFAVSECDAVKAAWEGQSHYSARETFWQKNGTAIPVEYWTHPVRLEGQLCGSVVVFSDISERQRNEELRTVLFECSTDAQLLYNEYGILEANAAAVTMLRMKDKEELLNRHPIEFGPERQPDGRLSSEKRVEIEAAARQHGSHRFLWTHRRSDGEHFPCEVTLTPVRLRLGPAFLVSWHDISERLQQEQALRESEERMKLALRGADLGIWDWSIPDSKTTYDERWAGMLGYKPEEIASDYRSWEKLVHPDDLSGVLSVLQEHLDGQTESYEAEHRLQHKSGRWVWILARGQVIDRDVAGNPLRACGTHLNITDRKQAEEARKTLIHELETTNAALEQKNNDLQQFAYIASHDLQTPLRTIVGFTQLIQSDYSDRFDETAHRHFDRIVNAGKRMRQLIDDLLSYSRVNTQTDSFAPISLNDVVDEVLILMHAIIEETDAVVTRDELPVVTADRSQITQLIQNLIGNAIKYSGVLPRVHLSARSQTKTGLTAEWVISVCDNGIGIPEENRLEIFDIFRRLHTQESYPGTGIGLAICRRIIERHGGRIWVDAVEESDSPWDAHSGSVFSFSIPDL